MVWNNLVKWKVSLVSLSSVTEAADQAELWAAAVHQLFWDVTKPSD